MGEATFASEVLGPRHVRAAKLEEIRSAAKKLRGAEAARFDGLLSLRDALESRDQLALESSRSIDHCLSLLRNVDGGIFAGEDAKVLLR